MGCSRTGRLPEVPVGLPRAGQVFYLEPGPRRLSERVPGISTECAGGGPAELLGRDFPELIVPPGDDKALANAIAAVLDRSPQLEGFKELAAQYSLDRMTRRFLDALEVR